MNDRFECPHCGALCEKDDTYCKKCLEKLTADDKTTEPAIEGLDDADVKKFVGKNSDYYLEKFKKAGNNKYFFQLNWPAIIFGQTWMFYRKMYLFAMKTYVLTTICALILVLPLSFAKKPLEQKLEAPQAALQEYKDECNKAANTAWASYDKERLDEYIESFGEKYDIKANRSKVNVYGTIIGLIELLCVLIPLALQVLVGLLSNSLYKQYIKKNIRTESGGTSVISVVAGHFIINALDLLMLLLPIPIISVVAYLVNLIR